MLFTNVNVATKLNELTSSILSYDELCCVNNRCVRILLPNLNFLNLMKKKNQKPIHTNNGLREDI